ncbi:MAG: hypothetical protein JSS02_20555 [Planctomycetes bacterium]|nr:hypothetical protein [Planctomycetota bacterium]
MLRFQFSPRWVSQLLSRLHRRRPRVRRSTFDPTATQTLEVRSMLSVSILNNGGQGVQGLSFAQSGGYIPPDTDMAAGQFSMIETVNQAVALYSNHDIGSLSVTDSLSHFFFTTGKLTRTDSGSMLSDPCCDIQEFNGQTRYVIGDQDVNFNTHKSSFDIAVSKTSNPTTLTAADWTFYKIDTTELNVDADYPGNFHNTGNALVFTLNMFAVGGTTGTYHTQVVSIPLADLFNGVATPQVFHNDIADFNLRPVAMHDTLPGDPEYLITAGADEASLTLYRMDNVLANTATFTHWHVPVAPFLEPVTPLNPNGTPITSYTDSRIQDGGEDSGLIVAAHTIGISDTQDAVAWYVIDINSGTPKLQQQGRIAAGDNTYVMYPGIDINHAGEIGVTYMKSGTDSPTDYMSMYVTGRVASDPLGTMQPGVLVPAGQGLANYKDFTPFGRSGDLAGLDIDPIDGSFWAANEYANTLSTANWGTAIANFRPYAAPQLFIAQGPPSTATAGTALAQPIIVDILNGIGQVDTSASTSVTLTISGGQFADGSTTMTVQAVQGVATFNGVTFGAIGSSGDITLTATDGDLPPALSGPVTVSAGAAAQMVVLSTPASGIAGTALTSPVTVAIQDQYGNLRVSDFATKVSIAVASGPGTFDPVSTLTVTALKGVATFSNLVLDVAGLYTLTPVSGALSAGVSNTLKISATTAAQLAFLGSSPILATAGKAVAPAVQVAIQDRFGNTVSATSSITLSLVGGTFSNGLTTASANAVAGVATFSTLTINKAGAYSLVANTGTLQKGTTAVTVSPNVASKLVYQSTMPTSVMAGVTFPPVVVSVQDAFTNVITTDSSTVTLTLSTGTFAGGTNTLTAPVVNGLATFTGTNALVINKTGASYRVTASDGALTTAASSTFAITPAAAASLVFQATPTSGTAGKVLATVLKVGLLDTFGNVVTTDNTTMVTVAVNSGPGTLAPTSTLSVKAVSGVASFSNLIFNTSGVYTLKVSTATLTSAASGNLTISPTAANFLQVAQAPTIATAGTALTPAVKIAVKDQFGNLVTAATPVTLTISTGTFSTGATALTANSSGGYATFSSAIINTVGTYTLSATSGVMTGVSFSVKVNAAAASKVVYLQAPPTTGVAGQVLTPAVVAAVQDRFGNLITTDNGSVMTLTLNTGTFANGLKTVSRIVSGGIATFSGTGLDLIVNKSGNYTLAASDGLLTKATSGTISIAAAAPVKLAFQALSTSGTAGVALATAGKVAVLDAYGNVVTNDASSVTLSVASGPAGFDPASTVTLPTVNGVAVFSSLIFTKVGKYTLLASDGALTTATSAAITINPNVATQLVVTQSPNTGVAGVALVPAVKIAVQDAYGNIQTAANTVTLTLDHGTFSTGHSTASAATSSGIATFSSLILNAAGSYNLTASAGALKATSLPVNVNAAAASKLVFVNPMPTYWFTGLAIDQYPVVAVQDKFGNTVTTDTSTVTLAVATGPAAFDVSSTTKVAAVAGQATFTNLVFNKVGTYTVKATDGVLTAVTSGTISVNPATSTNPDIQEKINETVEERAERGLEEVQNTSDVRVANLTALSIAYIDYHSSPLAGHPGLVTYGDVKTALDQLKHSADRSYVAPQVKQLELFLRANEPASYRRSRVISLLQTV